VAGAPRLAALSAAASIAACNHVGVQRLQHQPIGDRDLRSIQRNR
jgi:hypothetical protein